MMCWERRFCSFVGLVSWWLGLVGWLVGSWFGLGWFVGLGRLIGLLVMDVYGLLVELSLLGLGNHWCLHRGFLDYNYS